MFHTRRPTLLFSALAIGLLAFAGACGGDDGGDDGGGNNVTPDPPCEDCAVPPERPSAGVPGDGDGTVLAMNKLFLGNTDRSGVASNTAWKQFGFDIDGYKSTKTSSNHCKVYGKANPSNVKTDGVNGIDNSFGANIIPVITVASADAAQKIEQALKNGSFTLILEVKAIGGGKDYVNLPAALYAGASMVDDAGDPMTPNWDGNDEWPVYCELMQDCKASGTTQFPDAKSTVTFPSSYMTGGTWVSGDRGTVKLSLSLQGYALDLEINKAVITADMSGNPPTSATNGVIAGVLEAQKLVDSIAKVGGSISTSLCGDTPAFQSVRQGILEAADIMKDGTQDPSAVCDGISVGLGFEMKAVKLGKVLDKRPEGGNPCDGH